MERGKAEKAKTLKSLKNLRKINDFGLLGPSWEASWRLLGASWRPIVPSGGHLGRLGAILERFRALVGNLRSLLGPSWPVRGPFEAGSPSRRPTRVTPETPESARKRPRAPGNPGVRPLKKLQPWLLAVAAAAQQHSCEPWGTPLRARGTVADNAQERARYVCKDFCRKAIGLIFP